MSKHFIFSEDLFRTISDTDRFSTQIKTDSFGNIMCEENYICAYNGKKKLDITTEFIELRFLKNGDGRIKKLKTNCDVELYFLLHASDEDELDNISRTHFQINSKTQNEFWINSGGPNPLQSKTQVVFFMHERSCTAHSSFKRIWDNCASLMDFVEKIQELFEFHNIKKRDDKRKFFLTGLGYGDKTITAQANAEKNFMRHNDIKKYYV